MGGFWGEGNCAAPTALPTRRVLVPALTDWANFCRASGTDRRKPGGAEEAR